LEKAAYFEAAFFVPPPAPSPADFLTLPFAKIPFDIKAKIEHGPMWRRAVPAATRRQGNPMLRIRPDVMAAFRVDELGVYAHAASGFPDASFQGVLNPQFFSKGFHVHVPVPVGEHGVAGNAPAVCRGPDAFLF
jgi:hypothetical protein